MTTEYQPQNGTSWQVRMIQVFVVVAAIIVVFAGLTSIARNLASGIENESTATVAVEEGVEVEFRIEQGSPASVIGADLAAVGIVDDAAEFQAAVRSQGVASQLKAGSYVLTTGMALDTLIDMLIAGPNVDVYTVTVVEGLTVGGVLSSLAEQTPYTVTQFASQLTNGSVTSPYLPDTTPAGSNELARWEGLLAPDTYEFAADATPDDILSLMANTLARRVADVDWSLLEAMELEPYDGLIIASLIEKEAKLEEERPVISSVIHNRLTDGIALQVDATIIYALGVNRGEVTTADLQIESPYNTYLYPGLPPTPISGVRVSSLEAAAAPAETDFYYYVLIDQDGTHGFSTTLEEHNQKKEEAKAAGVLTP